jgi:hypothetical protein
LWVKPEREHQSAFLLPIIIGPWQEGLKRANTVADYENSQNEAVKSFIILGPGATAASVRYNFFICICKKFYQLNLIFRNENVFYCNF